MRGRTKSIPKSGRVPCSLDQFSFFFSASRGDNRKNAGYRTDTSLERFAFFRSRPKRGPLLDTLQLSPRPFVSRLVQSTNRNAPCRALAAREQRRQGRCPSSRGSVGRRRRCSIGHLALAAALPRGAPRVLAGQQQLAAAGQHDDCEPGPERGPERLLAQLPAAAAAAGSGGEGRSSSSATSEMGRDTEEAIPAAAENCACCPAALRRARLRPAAVAARAAEPD